MGTAWMRYGIEAALAFAGIAWSGSAGAAEWWVDGAAPAGGDGSEASPMQTLNQIKEVLHTGDTVLLRSGTYFETVDFWHVPVGVEGPTTIRAAPGATPIIDGGASGDFVLQAGETDDMVFQGLTLRNGGTGVGILFYQANGGQVIECTIENAGARGIEFYFAGGGWVYRSDVAGGVAGKGSEGTTIQESLVHDAAAEGITLHDNSSNLRYLNNVVYDNYHVNIYIDSAHEVVVDGNLVFWTGQVTSDFSGILLADEAYADVTAPVLRNIVITNNIVVNADLGIEFWDGSFPGQSALRDVLIANNTIVNSATLGIAWAEGPHENTVIRNNIVAQQSSVGVLLLNAKSTSGVTLDHNLWFMPDVPEPFNWGGGEVFTHEAWVAAAGQGQGDVVADPAFAGATWDLDAASYRLIESSPAIDTGTPVDGLTIDFDWGLRPAGDGYDLGAYEYGAEPNPDGGVPQPPDGGTGTGGQGASTSGASSYPHDTGGCGCRVARLAGPRIDWLALAGLALCARGRRRPRRRLWLLLRADPPI